MSANLVMLLAGLSALLALGLMVLNLRRQSAQLAELRQSLAQRDRQLELLQESLQGIGRKLLEQERRIGRLSSGAAESAASSSDSSDILRSLDQGKSVAEIASETGLDEVEISLLRQIHQAIES